MVEILLFNASFSFSFFFVSGFCVLYS
uniref:Uncharacterized protein n=1 Tax=Rhizophora mucronata TaxID=61149 RepID=A0A2P2QAD5_RHIMU